MMMRPSDDFERWVWITMGGTTEQYIMFVAKHGEAKMQEAIIGLVGGLRERYEQHMNKPNDKTVWRFNPISYLEQLI